MSPSCPVSHPSLRKLRSQVRTGSGTRAPRHTHVDSKKHTLGINIRHFLWRCFGRVHVRTCNACVLHQYVHEEYAFELCRAPPDSTDFHADILKIFSLDAHASGRRPSTHLLAVQHPLLCNSPTTPVSQKSPDCNQRVSERGHWFAVGWSG